MMTGFCESTKQFCFDNKMAIKISCPDMAIRVHEDLQPQIKVNSKNWVSLDMGVKSVNETFEFAFIMDPDVKLEKTMSYKLTVLHQYRRSKKISFIVREDIIKVVPGDSKAAIES